MPQLARRMGRAKQSAIMLVAEKARQLKAQGRDIISFSIGVPNFLPGAHVYDAARAALDADSGQYGSNRGADALLEAKGVACVPGSAFGEPRALRISYTCPEAQLAPGLQRFREFFAELA